MRSAVVALAVAALAAAAAAQAPKAKKKAAPAKPTLTEQQTAEIKAGIGKLSAALTELKTSRPAEDDLYADAAVCLKAAEWILRHNEFTEPRDIAATLRVLELGRQRAADLAAGKHPWTDAKGGLGRGYVSRIDGSVQPYAVLVPADYNGSAPVRLDVVLHGRDGKLNEVRHLAKHEGAKPAPGAALVLHVFGRVNNAYRWAGEEDVFEAIAAVKRQYRVDDRRIVLQGFSMGGAGAWHLGLHHPSAWCSVEAGAGFSETVKYARLTDLPDYQAKALHIYDASDYALNAFNVPTAGYGGELDAQRQASLNIVEALTQLGFAMKTDGLVTTAEGMDFRRIVGAKTEHKVDPASAKLLREFHDQRAAAGRNLRPARVRFVTYTLRYNSAAWLTVERLGEHYKRAEVDAEIQDGTVVFRKTENVAVLSLDRDAAERVRFGDQEFLLNTAADNLLPEVYYRHVGGGKWELMDYKSSRAFQKNEGRAKRHRLQGPIDDAFTGPFLCVRGTGTPWNPEVQKWADARLNRFAAEWDNWMRGRLPIKDDKDVTAEDLERYNVVLFGDPGSNSVLARMLPDLPLGWTKDEIRLDGTFPAAAHAPALIAPSPAGNRRYVVINSGHTFGAREFQGTNALLFPRLGDYAVFTLGGAETVKVSGYFDEDWKGR